MEQLYGVCNVAVAPLRFDPFDKSEMVSQLLFGDNVEVLEKTEKWWLVQNAYDGYRGWVDFKQLTEITFDDFDALQSNNFVAPTQINNQLFDEDGSLYHLSVGSNLPFYANGFCQIGHKRFEVCFEPHQIKTTNLRLQIIATAKFFQNAPYLWGGRHVLGIDCSGFTQIVFKMMGIKLKRDASQQVEQGAIVDFLAEVQPGDVAFFDNEEGKIIHVGIMLNPQEIIHASGKVRIDKIDDQGIFNAELGRYTHKLRIIKRFI